MRRAGCLEPGCAALTTGGLACPGQTGSVKGAHLLTVLLSKLLGLLIRDVPLGLQICLVPNQDDDLDRGAVGQDSRLTPTHMHIKAAIRSSVPKLAC